jgi:hypothetical protein
MAPMLREHRARAALLAIAAALALGGCGASEDTATTTGPGATTARAGGAPQLGPAFGSMTSLPGALSTPPPWRANAEKLQQRLRAIGLAPLREEGQVLHIHQHLDLYVDGRRVTVPGDIGIDPSGGLLSDLHTHASYPPGIIHVESPTQASFTLGQFFAVWGVPLSATCIGSLCERGAKKLHVWVNGRRVTADPTRIVLAEHQEIVVAYGTAAQMPKPVPASYDFAAAGL